MDLRRRHRLRVLRMEDFRDRFQQFASSLGMWTIHASFLEACAFVSGFDAAMHGKVLVGFRPWLVARTGSDRPELAFPSLVFQHAFPDLPSDLRALAPDDDARATGALFALLDEYFKESGMNCE